MRGQIAMLHNKLKEQEERSKELDEVVQALQVAPKTYPRMYTAQSRTYSSPLYPYPSNGPIYMEGQIGETETPAKDAYPSIGWDYYYGDSPSKFGRLSPWKPISNLDKDEYNKIKEREKEVQQSQIKVSAQEDTSNELQNRVAKQETITEEKKNLIAKYTSQSGSLIFEPGLYNLTFASGLSIPSGPTTSSIYLEISEVTKEYVKIRLQKMNLEIENLTPSSY
jgi:hypothetical protein